MFITLLLTTYVPGLFLFHMTARTGGNAFDGFRLVLFFLCLAGESLLPFCMGWLIHTFVCLLYYLSKFIIRFTVSPSDVLLHLATT